jgi:tRNA threonylcarbamoyladenosine biosynthesis protein TsaE
MGRIITNASLEELPEIAKDLLSRCADHKVFCFYGELGAGKTTLIKELICQIEKVDKNKVQSPTFLMCNVYEKVAHFDLYRLKSSEEFLLMGFDELFETHRCFIEWPEKIEPLLPRPRVDVYLTHQSETTRHIEYAQSVKSN